MYLATLNFFVHCGCERLKHDKVWRSSGIIVTVCFFNGPLSSVTQRVGEIQKSITIQKVKAKND